MSKNSNGWHKLDTTYSYLTLRKLFGLILRGCGNYFYIIGMYIYIFFFLCILHVLFYLTSYGTNCKYLKWRKIPFPQQTHKFHGFQSIVGKEVGNHSLKVRHWNQHIKIWVYIFFTYLIIIKQFEYLIRTG